MRKINLIPIVILLVILSFTLWNSSAVSRHAARWQMQLQSTVAPAQAEDWNTVSSALEQSYADWSARQPWLHMITQHNTVDDAEAMYRRAMAFAATQEPCEFQAEISDLIAQLQLLAETEQFSIGNIL